MTATLQAPGRTLTGFGAAIPVPLGARSFNGVETRRQAPRHARVIRERR